jgi:signal transduction histidine kinase
MKRSLAIAVAAALAGAAAVTVPHKMGWPQIALVLLAIAGGAVAAWLATRLVAEERSRREVEAARRRLVASVSHDLRTPLASLRLLVESIDDGVVTGETRDRYLGEIRTHVAALSGLIDDLFELSRIEAGDITWTMSQVELRELVGDTVAAMRAPAAARGVSLAAELPGEDLLARANAEKLQRVLFNLIQNAIRHTPADGTVRMEAHRREDGVELIVEDTGEGIDPAALEQVFEPFWRGDAARSSAGSGLGLALAKRIVEALGGQIQVQSEPAGGARFAVLLPRSG